MGINIGPGYKPIKPDGLKFITDTGAMIPTRTDKDEFRKYLENIIAGKQYDDDGRAQFTYLENVNGKKVQVAVVDKRQYDDYTFMENLQKQLDENPVVLENGEKFEGGVIITRDEFFSFECDNIIKDRLANPLKRNPWGSVSMSKPNIADKPSIPPPSSEPAQTKTGWGSVSMPKPNIADKPSISTSSSEPAETVPTLKPENPATNTQIPNTETTQNTQEKGETTFISKIANPEYRDPYIQNPSTETTQNIHEKKETTFISNPWGMFEIKALDATINIQDAGSISKPDASNVSGTESAPTTPKKEGTRAVLRNWGYASMNQKPDLEYKDSLLGDTLI